jgi:hypothetical protein
MANPSKPADFILYIQAMHVEQEMLHTMGGGMKPTGMHEIELRGVVVIPHGKSLDIKSIVMNGREYSLHAPRAEDKEDVSKAVEGVYF